MGQYNSFYLDDSVIPLHYQNLYAIAFNSSSRLLIRYCSNSNTQNLAVFIIPAENCNQHAFYAMSKNIFKIAIETKKFDYNMQICVFSPSFVSNVRRIVTFGYKNSISGDAQIFYGINQTKLQPNLSSSRRNNQKDSLYDQIIKELDKYINVKNKHRNMHNNLKININPTTQKSDFFNLIKNLKNRIILFRNHNKLKKDYDEERYFKNIYSKSQIQSQLKHETNIINPLSISPSPGFLVSLKISSEYRQLDIVNSTFYVGYSVNEPNVNAKLIINRVFDKKGIKNADTSMLDKHTDFLLYYDKYKSKFIYDKDWAHKIDISYKENIWEKMKWILLTLVIIFIVITLLIIGCLFGFIRSDKLFCLRRKNSGHNFTNESDISFERYRSERATGCGIFNEYDINDDHLETIYYSPNLDDTITYQNFSKQNKRSSVNSIKHSDNSDNYSYEYEYDHSDDENIDNSSDNYSKNGKRKRKLKKNTLNYSGSLAASPYQLDINNCADINYTFISDNKNNYLQNVEKNDVDLYSAESSEEMVNPYKLPHSPSFL